MLITDYLEYPVLQSVIISQFLDTSLCTESGPAFPVVTSSAPRSKCSPCSTLNFLSVPMQMCEYYGTSQQRLRTADQLTTCRIAFAAWAQPGLYCICIEW